MLLPTKYRRTLFIATLALTVVSVLSQSGFAQQRATQYGQMKPGPKRLFDSWAVARNMGEGRTITPRERFESLSVSQRSTFASATNALLYTRLTDPKGRPIGSAIDLVSAIEVIAGQEPGKGSDEQFRLYVKLKPGAREKLELSREFQHGKNNTIFHKGYPINYRQSGPPPTMQYSIAIDEVGADIDVDYRSSGFPAALFNGHLSASNSDVRAAGNYQTHLRRWPGLVDWWETDFPDLVAEFNRMEQAHLQQQHLAVALERRPDNVVPVGAVPVAGEGLVAGAGHPAGEDLGVEGAGPAREHVRAPRRRAEERGLGMPQLVGEDPVDEAEVPRRKLGLTAHGSGRRLPLPGRCGKIDRSADASRAMPRPFHFSPNEKRATKAWPVMAMTITRAVAKT